MRVGQATCVSGDGGSDQRERVSIARGTFIGLRNYQDILTDPFFWTVVARTIVFAGGADARFRRRHRSKIWSGGKAACCRCAIPTLRRASPAARRLRR